MVFPLISEYKTTTGRTYGGDALYMAMAYLSGLDLAASDITNKATIGTETSYWYDKFNLWDFNHDYILKFLTPSLEHNAIIGFPDDLEDNPTVNEILFNHAEQEIFNKTIDGELNTLLNIKDSSIADDAAIGWDKISLINASLLDFDIIADGLGHGKSIRWNVGENAWEFYTPLEVGVAGTGDITLGTNKGSGYQVFKDKTSGSLNFRTLIAGSNVTITNTTDEITIASAVGVGEANTGANVGTRDGLIFRDKTSTTLNFKKLAAGPNITITNGTDEITIEAAATNLPASLVKTDQTNTFGSFMQSFANDLIKIRGSSTGSTLLHSAVDDGTDYTLTLPKITGTLVARNTSDTLLNKTLTDPIIARIANGTGLWTVPINVTDQFLGRNTTDTVTLKTIATDNNTIKHSTTNNAGDLLVNNGTKFDRQVKGSNGQFWGVSGGVAGYYTPDAGGGSLPDGSAKPSNKRWGALYGGTNVGAGWLTITPTVSGSLSTILKSSTEALTRVTTAATDDSIAELKGNAIWSRQSNLTFKAKWELPQTTNTVVMVGLNSLATLPTGGSHDTPLNSAHGVMITVAHDIESVYQIARNDGNSTQVKAATTASATTTTSHTVTIVMTSSDVTITLDALTPVVYTTRLPASTTPLYPYMHVEAIGGTAKSIDSYYMQLVED